MNELESLFRHRAFKVDPSVQRVVKFLPNSPPQRGDVVIVDGERCRVRRAKIAWDGPRWTIKKLYVKAEPA
jgi:hypothetical protein